MKRWHVWTEDHSRDGAAVMLAWSARDAACAFAESHSLISDGFAFAVLVSDIDSQDVESFEFERKDAEPVQRDPLELALSKADERIAAVQDTIVELERELIRARKRLATYQLSRERWTAQLARAAAGDALRRQGSADGEARRREAAGE